VSPIQRSRAGGVAAETSGAPDLIGIVRGADDEAPKGRAPRALRILRGDGAVLPFGDGLGDLTRRPRPREPRLAARALVQFAQFGRPFALQRPRGKHATELRAFEVADKAADQLAPDRLVLRIDTRPVAGERRVGSEQLRLEAERGRGSAVIERVAGALLCDVELCVVFGDGRALCAIDRSFACLCAGFTRSVDHDWASGRDQ
jgi:hypothetical protein